MFCFETERLILRPFAVTDAEAMFTNWASDPEVSKYLTWNPHQSPDNTRMLLEMWVKEYEDPSRLNFAIVEKETGELIGNLGVVGCHDGVPELGYVLSRKVWGRGYMTEACRALIERLFAMGHARVDIRADERNTGSNRVIVKSGGRFTGKGHVSRPLKGDTSTVNCYAVTEDSFYSPTGSGIEIREYREYKEEEALPLYKAAGWTNYVKRAEILPEAFKNSLAVLAAFDGERLVGLIRAVGDGVSILFIQDLLVLPEYRRLGSGSRLIRALLAKYENVYQAEAFADDTEALYAFYTSAGFKRADKLGCVSFIKM